MNAHLVEAAVLAHHGVPMGTNLTESARDAGVVSACLGCGTVIVAAGFPFPSDVSRTESILREARRLKQRDDLLAWGALDCCDDADTVVY